MTISTQKKSKVTLYRYHQPFTKRRPTKTHHLGNTIDRSRISLKGIEGSIRSPRNIPKSLNLIFAHTNDKICKLTREGRRSVSRIPKVPF